MAVLVRLRELSGGRCMPMLPGLLWEGSSAHFCGFVVFLPSWPWIPLLLLYVLTSFPTRHRTKPAEFSFTGFTAACSVSNSSTRSRLAVRVCSEQC